MTTLNILYASTSGNTEYVVQALAHYLGAHAKDLTVHLKRVELATVDDLTSADITLLASGSWNTGGREGQVNPHMYVYLFKKAKDVDLTDKKFLVVGLGDDRYKYTGRATEHMAHFVKEHGGSLFIPPLVIVNDPYGQEEHVEKWGAALIKKLLS